MMKNGIRINYKCDKTKTINCSLGVNITTILLLIKSTGEKNQSMKNFKNAQKHIKYHAIDLIHAHFKRCARAHFIYRSKITTFLCVRIHRQLNKLKRRNIKIFLSYFVCRGCERFQVIEINK